jgi:hypothetical protein
MMAPLKTKRLILLSLVGAVITASSAAVELRVGSFKVDATPPVGSPLCFALVPPSTGTNDPLSARGVVLQAAGELPIVLVAVDWVGIGNTGHDEWRATIATACGTTVERVAVHTLHQHDAPGCDFLAEEVAATAGLGGELFDVEVARDVIARSAAAAREALASSEPATHVGVGAGRVEQVASNRRILGADGKVEFQRMSSCTNPSVREMPEGTIDPLARVVSFWRDDKLLVALTYYTTHPQSYYRTGKTSADFVGLARDAREAALGGTRHVHFNGASGNIAAGKYNDGSHEMRPILAERLAAGLETAWNATEKSPLADAEFNWTTQAVALSPNERLGREQLQSTLHDATATKVDRLQAARSLAFLSRCDAGHEISLARLRIGPVDMLHVPGELFVEYQLAAQQLAPHRVICTAAYGDYGPGYIGLNESYAQGGYETDVGSRVSPRAEAILMRAIGELVK